MSDSSLTIFTFQNNPVRSETDQDGNPWFFASDVCKVLAIANMSDALSRLDADEKGVGTADTAGGQQQVAIVNESGLYYLILTSRKAEAKAFKRWITHEVLPAIRKTGTYTVKALSHLDMAENMLLALRQQQREIDELRINQGDLALKIESGIDAINSRLDNAEYFRVETYCKQQGIKYPDSVRQKWGKDASELSRARGIQIRKEPVSGKKWIFENMYHQSILAEVCVVANVWQANQLSYLDGEQ